MRFKYHAILLMTLIMAVPEANATNDYSILVGTHEISFNTSSSFFENLYETTYSPTRVGISKGQYDPDYTKSYTTLTAPIEYKPFLYVEVRDYVHPMSLAAQALELDTIGSIFAFLPMTKVQNSPIGIILGMDYELLENNKGEAYGVMVKWPSDQIEVIMVGNLPSRKIWQEISDSLELVR
jgi:hypothetical protein